MRFSTSLSAAVLLAFFPNVWFYGGGAFSDVPSMTLMMAACALLLAGCRNPRAYLGGAVVLAISAGFRPQNLLVGLAPLAMATLFQIRRSAGRVAGAIGVLVVIIGVSYLTAAFLTGWSEYRQALRIHQAYIAGTDSFLSPSRPPLWRVFDDFFVMPYHAPVINAILCALALIAVIRIRPYTLAALAAFGPLCVVSWLMLDRFSASRFSIGYAPLMALLAADGLQWIARRAEPIASAAVIASMVSWTWPALAVVGPSIAPPVAAVDWIRNHVNSKTATIYVDSGMVPFAEWYLPEYKLRFIGESQPPPRWSPRQPGFYLREMAVWSPHAQNFRRPHGHLWQLVRQRYFDVSVRPVNEIIVFGEGWYEEELGDQPWRWMAARSVATLPPMPGDGRLTLSFYIPLDALESPPDIVIRINGAIVDRFRANRSVVDRAITVRARSDASIEMVIETDRVVTPAAQHINADTRALGLRLNSIAWMPAR